MILYLTIVVILLMSTFAYIIFRKVEYIKGIKKFYNEFEKIQKEIDKNIMINKINKKSLTKIK
jgi:hypothetical protein